MKINFIKEGQTPIDADEQYDLIPNIKTLEELNWWEHENIIEAKKWLLNPRILGRYDVCDVDFLLILHKKMFNRTWKWAGLLRKTDKNIGCDPTTIRTELKILLDDTKFWQDNNIYSIKELALLFHHRLVKIHLFPNGNGRHARLVADCIVQKLSRGDNHKINWQGSKKMSPKMLRQKYLSALRKADNGNYDELFNLFDA